MKPDLTYLKEVFLHKHGIDLGIYDETFLGNSFSKSGSPKATQNPVEQVTSLFSDTEAAKAFLQSLQPAYSTFFRNPFTFAVLEQLVFPMLAERLARKARSGIRVWSAACAAGQEAYSVAISLMDMESALDKKFPSRIFATDISPDQLLLAKARKYRATDLGNIKWTQLEKYFSRDNNTFSLLPGPGEKVDFSLYDLLDKQSTCPPASIYGDFDIVFCCNVLFYYARQERKFILDKISKTLAPGGFLICGETERETVMNLGYREVFPLSAVFQRVPSIKIS